MQAAAKQPAAEAPPLDYFFGGVSAFAEQLDKTVLAVLRDGRHIVGTLASYDHFGSLVLLDARERHFGGGKYCDLPMGGVYLIRGENLSLLGEVSGDGDAGLLVAAEWEEVRALEEEAEAAAKLRRQPTATMVWHMEN